MEINWITGVRGFMGRHLARKVAATGITIGGIDCEAWSLEEAGRHGVQHHVCGPISLVNLDLLAEQSGIPSIIFHLAGSASVGHSFQSVDRDYQQSVHTTQQVLEWIRLTGVDSRLVLVSSAAVYGQGLAGVISEQNSCNPYSPYGSHKRMAELLCNSYSRNFELKTAIIRFFSVFGEGLRKQLLWDLCCRFSKHSSAVRLDGRGDEKRDWLHIDDATDYLIRVSKYACEDTFIVNGGSGIPTTILQMTQAVRTAYSSDAAIQFSGISRPGDPDSLVADTILAKSLGLFPRISLENGLLRYVNWYKSYTTGGC